MPNKNNNPRVRKNNSRSKDAFYVRVVSGDGQAAFVNATKSIGKPIPFQKPRATLAMSVFDDVVAFSLLHMTPKTAKTVKERPISIPAGSMTRLRRRANRYSDIGLDEVVVELSTRIRKEEVEEVPNGDGLDGLFDADPADNNLEDLFSEQPASDGLDDLFSEQPSSEADETGKASEPTEEAPKRRAAHQYEIQEWRGALSRSASGLASFDVPTDFELDLPLHPVNVSVYMKSPTTGRMLAVAFIGHLGKPGSAESVERMAAKVINSMVSLPEFQLLSSIEAVNVPTGGGFEASTSVDNTIGRASFVVKTYCFNDELAATGSGDVQVTVDLQNANPSTGKLFYSFQPQRGMDGFADCETMLEAAVTATMLEQIGVDGLSQITYDIILGGINAETVALLADTGASIGAVDVTPTRWRKHS